WIAAAAAAARGDSLAEVAAGWAGQPAALAAYTSRMETTSGMSADRLAAAVGQDATAGFGCPPSWRGAGGQQPLGTGLSPRWPRPRPRASAAGQAGGWLVAPSSWPRACPGGWAQRYGWTARSAPWDRT